MASTKSEWLSFHDVNHVKFRILTLLASHRAKKIRFAAFPPKRHLLPKLLRSDFIRNCTISQNQVVFFSSVVMTVSSYSSFFLKNIKRKRYPKCLLMKIFINVSLFLRVFLGQCSITDFKVKTRLERSFSLYAFKTTYTRYFLNLLLYSHCRWLWLQFCRRKTIYLRFRCRPFFFLSYFAFLLNWFRVM